MAYVVLVPIIIVLLGFGTMSRPAGAPLAVTAQPVELAQQQWDAPPPLTIDASHKYAATISTSFGEMEIELFAAETPVTVNNFVFLANEGFYDGVPFHRIIKDFMIQTGDPTGTGRGGPGYRFEDEGVTRQYTKGIVAMANAGPNTNGSQFFIMHAENYPLPPNYTIFGQVVGGLGVVDAIATVPVSPSSAGGEPSAPDVEVRIDRVTIQVR
jgi:cyclophilin family peptidyl-prolyl cis-trans isomerase